MNTNVPELLRPEPGLPGVRDLADDALWQRSLERAHHRRHIAELSRRSARRRKATSVALAGAVATSPATPVIGLAGAQTDRPAAELVDDGPTHASTPLLERGSVGDAVAQVQRRVGVDDDGIFGPITERAVRRFQAAHGLAPTGVVDAATWAAIFRSKVLFMRAAPVADAADFKAAAPAIVTRSAQAPGMTPVSSPAGDDAPAGEPSADGGPERDASPARDRDPSRARGGAPERERSSAGGGAPDPSPAPRPSAPSLSGACSTVTPVKGIRTGDFGEDRGSHRHAGIDIAAAAGTAVRAAACGRIVTSGVQSGYGNLVCIEHAGGTTTCYAHLSRIDVRMRQWVRSGEVIGTVGCTGRCTGPHLHFEVRENGRPVDPSGYVNGTRSLPRGDGGRGGSTPTAARRASSPRATTATTPSRTWSSGSGDGDGGGWSSDAAEPRAEQAAEQPEPAPAAAPVAEQPAPEPAPAGAPVAAEPAAAPAAAQAAPAPAAAVEGTEGVAAPAPAATPAAADPAPAAAPVVEQPAPEPAPAAAPVAKQPAPEPAPAAAPDAAEPAPAAAPVAEQPVAAPAAAQAAPAPAAAAGGQ